MKTFAQWVIALTRGYIKATGKKPDKLAKLKINMEAGQKVKDQNKVIEFPRDKITDWTKPRPGEAKVGELQSGIMKATESKPTAVKTEAQIKSQIEKQNKESIANINRQMIEEDRAIKDMYRTAGPRTLDEDAGYLAEFLADDAGKFLDDLPIAEQTKFYNRAKNALIRHQKKKPDPEDFAGGGVAGMLGEPTYQDDNHRVPYGGGGAGKPPVTFTLQGGGSYGSNEIGPGLDLTQSGYGFDLGTNIDLPFGFSLTGGVGIGRGKTDIDYNDQNVFSDVGETKLGDKWNVGLKWSKKFNEGGRVPLKGGKLAGLEFVLKQIMEKFGKKSITTADKIKRPLKAIEAEDTKAAFDRLTNKINTQEALTKGSEKMAGPIENVNQKSIFEPVSTDATTWLKQEKFFNPKALDMYGNKVPSNWIEVEKKAAKKMIDDLGPLDVSPNHPNYKDMKAIRQSAKDRLESIKVTEALGGNITMHDWLRMNRKNIKMSDYIKKEGTPVVKDELSGIKKAFIEKKSSPWFKDPKTLTPEEELRREFPGITDDLIKNILTDDNPQRIAEVKAAMKEAMKMQEKGMPVDEIINIFKKTPTKHASGGLAGMLGE